MHFWVESFEEYGHHSNVKCDNQQVCMTHSKAMAENIAKLLNAAITKRYEIRRAAYISPAESGVAFYNVVDESTKALLAGVRVTGAVVEGWITVDEARECPDGTLSCRIGSELRMCQPGSWRSIEGVFDVDAFIASRRDENVSA